MTAKPNISLHALFGSSNPKTMMVKGKIAVQWIVILIDTCSIHNFLDPAIVKGSEIPIYFEGKVKVRVANGDSLISEGKILGVRVNIYGFSFTLDLFALESIGCDMVLGVQWLQILGIISWNFKLLCSSLWVARMSRLCNG